MEDCMDNVTSYMNQLANRSSEASERATASDNAMIMFLQQQAEREARRDQEQRDREERMQREQREREERMQRQYAEEKREQRESDARRDRMQMVFMAHLLGRQIPGLDALDPPGDNNAGRSASQ